MLQVDLFGEPVEPRPAPPAGAAAPDDLYSLPDFEESLGRFDTVAELGGFAQGCHRCGLRAGCSRVVFGEGPEDAALVLIGEGPGANEDQQGRPFCGRAGDLLDRILAAVGFRREDVYVSNVVLCRPPGNRAPSDGEMAACRPWLERRLQLLRPRVVVALGATAARALLHPQARITQVRGQWHRRGEAWIMPTFHPAALLRDPSKKRPVWEDFQQVREVCLRLDAPAGG